MKLTLISDLHGHLPEIEPCDVLVIAGDICPVWNHRVDFQERWLRTEFKPWLAKQPCTNWVGTMGNHDWIGQLQRDAILPEMRHQLLFDESLYLDGLHFYGSPWSPAFRDWAFNATEDELARKYEAIPACDVLITHCPPWGYGDAIYGAHRNLGSMALAMRLGSLEPSLHICGHIHGGHGIYLAPWGTTVNAALLDDKYVPTHRQICAEFEGNKLLDVWKV